MDLWIGIFDATAIQVHAPVRDSRKILRAYQYLLLDFLVHKLLHKTSKVKLNNVIYQIVKFKFYASVWGHHFRFFHANTLQDLER